MGASTSHSPVSGHLFVETPTRNYHAGEQVSGTIHLILTQPIPAETVFLKFKGSESAVINTFPGTSYEAFRRRMVQPGSYFNGTIVCQRVPIFQFTEAMTGPGQFSFPFLLTLPSSIPSSFNVADACTISFVKYSISASLTCRSAAVKNHKLKLSISQVIDDPAYSVTDYEDNVVWNGCLSRRGVVRLKMNFQKSEFYAGEQVKIIADVDNSHGSCAINGLEATLVRRMLIETVDKGHITYIRQLKASRVDCAVPPGTALLGQSSVRIGLTLDDYEHDINEAVTVRSRIVRCEYSIRLIAELNRKKLCSSENPGHERLIKVLPVQLQPLVPTNVPISWRPEVQSLVKFDIISEHSNILPPSTNL